MVGSVLMQRMIEERDFDGIRPVFFSTSQHGQAAPAFAGHQGTLQDAYDIDALSALDIIITCQGGDYTNQFIRSCVKSVGKAIGLTPLLRCVCKMTPLLFWIRLTTM